MDFDPKGPVTHAVLENTFKMGQLLQLQKKYDLAIEKYKEVCYSMADILKEHPEAEFHLIPLSIGKAVEIYRERDDIDKALALMKVERKFLETMAASKEDFKSEDGDGEFKCQKHDINKLLREMKSAFEMKKPATQSPEEIVKMLLEERKKQEQEAQQRNMQRLLEIAQERKNRLANSRWERFTDWLSNNPVVLIIGVVVLLGSFLIFMLVKIGVGERPAVIRNNKDKKQRTREHPDPKSPDFDYDELREKLEEMKKDLSKTRAERKSGQRVTKKSKETEEL